MQKLIEFSSLLLFCAFLWGGRAHAMQFPYPGWCGEGHHVACHAIGTGATTLVVGQATQYFTHSRTDGLVAGIIAGVGVSVVREQQKPHWEASSVRGDLVGILAGSLLNFEWRF
ncbi:MAG: hypothetical protein KGI54_18425 [Pseudomonadota bacterium]|nr:hypothetical protein [Pseudomonadota bacterium]